MKAEKEGGRSEFQSNPVLQEALAWFCVAVGGALIYAGRDYSGAAQSEVLAGLLLGVLSLIIGIAAFLTVAKQTIVIDPRTRCITVEDANSSGIKTRSIHFSEIEGTGIGYLGRSSTFIGFYYIVLKLKNGEEFSLFAPGRFYVGGFDRAVMESRRQRLEEMLRA